MNAPKKVAERLATGMKRMRPIIEAQDRDVSEAAAESVDEPAAEQMAQAATVAD